MSKLQYQSGFANEFATEAVAGALPKGQNAPQKSTLGLYTEQFSGTPFTAPRATNRRAWLYRIRPSVTHRPFVQLPETNLRSGPFKRGGCNSQSAPMGSLSHSLHTLRLPGRHHHHGRQRRPGWADRVRGAHLCREPKHVWPFLCECRWRDVDPAPDGKATLLHRAGHSGGCAGRSLCYSSRTRRCGSSSWKNSARGYICENYGLPFVLPDLGLIGANGLANPRDFLYPVAAFEDVDGDFQTLCKFQGKLWSAGIDHSPLDVVGWHGNYAPYKYDMANFNCINTVSFDHPDPSSSTACPLPPPRCRALPTWILLFFRPAGWWPSIAFALRGSIATQ